MSLYCLADDFAYGDLKHQVIRDRIVVGILDQALSERLQMDPELTLEKAKTQVRQREAVHEQAQILKQSGDTTLAAVHQKQSYKGNSSNGAKSQHSKKAAAPAHANKCTRCGREPHKRQQCPARDATCHKCSKKGHFSSQCFSKRGKQVADITTADQGQDFAYLSTLGSHPSACLCLPISINGKVVDFKIDIGAEVTAITPSTYNLISAPKLDKPLKSLRGLDRKPLSTLGMMEVRLSHEERHCQQSVYVIEDLEENPLGLPAIRESSMSYLFYKKLLPHIKTSSPHTPKSSMALAHFKVTFTFTSSLMLNHLPSTHPAMYLYLCDQR